MIQINETDLPITVAEKLINAKYEIPEDATILKTLNKMCGGDGVKCAFTDDELLEIAEYLIIYCKHQEKMEEGVNNG